MTTTNDTHNVSEASDDPEIAHLSAEMEAAKRALADAGLQRTAEDVPVDVDISHG
jgi:hypothetical protein